MPPSRRNEVVIALIGAVAALGAAYLGKSRGEAQGKAEGESQIRLIVEAFDTATSQGIPGVKLVLHTTDGPREDVTDGAGRHTFRLPPHLALTQGRLSFEKASYHRDDRELRFPKGEDEIRVFMKPEALTIATPVSPPPPSPTPPASPGPAITRVFSSGPKTSGAGGNFSAWYTLCSDTPPGYKVLSAAFRLSGDRSCGAWANCRPSVQTDDQVCWEFQMQGHNEWPPPGQSVSEGQLTVQFGPR